MATRKNHHFLSQFYFRRFSMDGKSICAIQRKSGRLISGAPIKGQASQNWFYGHHDEIEEGLGVLEGNCSSALRALDECKNPLELDDDMSSLLLIWLALQRSRTEAARTASKGTHNRFMQLQAEAAIHSDESFDSDTKELLLGSLDLVQADPVKSHLLEMLTAVQNSGVLRDLTQVLLVNRTNRPFIFGDAPVVFYNGYYRNVKLRGVLGLDTPGLMVVHPISPNVCLLLIDADRYKVKRLVNNKIAVKNSADIAAINKLQLHAASSCVYFHDQQFGPYVQTLWEQEKKYLAEQVNTIVEVPGFSSETGEPMGDIIHVFQPQLPYKLKLTFLEHVELDDMRYRFGRRGER